MISEKAIKQKQDKVDTLEDKAMTQRMRAMKMRDLCRKEKALKSQKK